MFQYGCHPSYVCSEHYLPDDAKICGARYDEFRDITELLIESESYAEVADKAMPPVLTPPTATYVQREPA